MSHAGGSLCGKWKRSYAVMAYKWYIPQRERTARGRAVMVCNDSMK